MENKIYSLEQLQKEKEKLLNERDICKNEFFRSLNFTKSHAKDVLLKSALTASAIGLVTMVIRKLNSPDYEQQSSDRPASKLEFFLSLVPVILPLLQNYFNEKE